MRIPQSVPMAERTDDKRLFTVEEANGLLPRLEAWLADMRALKRRMEELGPSVETVVAAVHENSGGRSASDFLVAFHRFRRLAARIEGEGVLLRDVEMGLVDFPALRFEREVYLCWRSGEPVVAHWHDVEDGFAGRRRLDETDDADVRPKAAGEH
jgi:hypothetical protein